MMAIDTVQNLASKLRDAWSMIDNALDGLAMRGEKDSPLVRDLQGAQEEVDCVRHALHRDVVDATLERAAMVCVETDEDGENPDCWGWHAKDYAKAIRALKANEKGDRK
jgi:hypothetical protein